MYDEQWRTKNSGIPLELAEPGFLGRIAHGESGQFINNLLEELFAREPDLRGPFLAYEVCAPDGGVVRVRAAAAP